MIADLDTLLTALYVELTDRIIPLRAPRRPGPGRPAGVTDAELVCRAVAQVLLRFDDERHWLRAAPARVGHLFPRLLRQSECGGGQQTRCIRWSSSPRPMNPPRMALRTIRPVGSVRPRWAGPGAHCWARGRWGYSLRATSGPVIRLSSGSVDAMMPRDARRPAATMM